MNSIRARLSASLRFWVGFSSGSKTVESIEYAGFQRSKNHGFLHDMAEKERHVDLKAVRNQLDTQVDTAG